MESWQPPQGQGEIPPSRHQSHSRLRGEPWLTVGQVAGRGVPLRSPLSGGSTGDGWGWREGASATHRQAEMLPIVAVQFMVPLFQSWVNHQLVTSPMVVPPLARRAGLRRGLLVVVVGVTVLHAVNPT